MLYVFAATLGLHAGMTYANSGVAVATSLGTVFFLFVGVAVCMRIMMAFSGSFSAGVSAVLRLHGVWRRGAVRGAGRPQPVDGHRRGLVRLPDRHVLRHHQLPDGAALAAGVFLVTVAAYGFTTAAMLVPAICEFDVATGRTTLDE